MKRKLIIEKGNPYTNLRKARRYRMLLVISLIFVIIGISLKFTAYVMKEKDAEKERFMAYCTEQRFSSAACEWEYERIKNGAKTMILPMFRQK